MSTIPKGRGGTFNELFDDVTETLYVFDPRAPTLRALAVAAGRHEGATPRLRVLAGETTLLRFQRDFVAAATAAGLAADGRLTVRTDETTHGTTVFASRDAVFVPVRTPDTEPTVAAGERGVAADVFATCREAWRTREPFQLQTPPLSTVDETLTAEFGTEAAADFRTALATAADRDDPTAFDPVTTVLLVGARYDRLHYDVSNWGERLGVASKATFSRKKGQLEADGVIETSQEASRPGRPRQRLSLTADSERRVAEAGFETVVTDVLY